MEPGVSARLRYVRTKRGELRCASPWCKKIIYNTQAEAEREARYLARLRDEPVMRAYRDHGGWHLTSRTNEDVQRKRLLHHIYWMLWRELRRRAS